MSMKERIVSTLQMLQPEHLEVLDESHMHSRGTETHYKAVLVSERFAGLNSVKRHQLVYGTLGELMGEFPCLGAAHLHAAGMGAGRCCTGIAHLRWRWALSPEHWASKLARIQNPPVACRWRVFSFKPLAKPCINP